MRFFPSEVINTRANEPQNVRVYLFYCNRLEECLSTFSSSIESEGIDDSKYIQLISSNTHHSASVRLMKGASNIKHGLVVSSKTYALGLYV